MKRRTFLKVAGGVTGGVALGVGVEMIRPTLVSAAEAAAGAANAISGTGGACVRRSSLGSFLARATRPLIRDPTWA